MRVVVIISLLLSIYVNLYSQEILYKTKVLDHPDNEAACIFSPFDDPLTKGEYLVLSGTKISHGSVLRSDMIKVVNKYNGSLIWERFIGELINDYFIFDDKVVVITEHNTIFSFNLSDGNSVWSYPSFKNPPNNNKRYYIDPRKLNTMHVSSTGYIYEDKLYFLDISNNSVIVFDKHGDIKNKYDITSLLKKYNIQDGVDALFFEFFIIDQYAYLMIIKKPQTIFGKSQTYIIQYDLFNNSENNTYLLSDSVTQIIHSGSNKSLVLKTKNKIVFLNDSLNKTNEIILNNPSGEYCYEDIKNNTFITYSFYGIFCFNLHGDIIWEFPKGSSNFIKTITSILSLGTMKAVERPFMLNDQILVKIENSIYLIDSYNGKIIKQFDLETNFPQKKDLYYLAFSAQSAPIEIDKEKKLFGFFLTHINKLKQDSRLFDEEKTLYSDYYYVIRINDNE